jgi:hypothetical protein
MSLNGRDPIHLNAAGYQALANNQMQHYFLPKLRGTPALSLDAQLRGRSGWVRADGILGQDFVIMGDDGRNNGYRGLLSYDTSAIPPRADIIRATIYLTRTSECCGENPFTSAALGQARVELVTGSFNLPEIEAIDYDAAALVQDGGVFFGSVSEVGYTLRIELNEAGIAAINRDGLTQLRLQFPGTDGGADWIGFDNGAQEGAGPKLEVYYGEPAFSPFDLFDPDYQNEGAPSLTMLLLICLCGLALGGIGLTGMIILRRRQPEQNTNGY